MQQRAAEDAAGCLADLTCKSYTVQKDECFYATKYLKPTKLLSSAASIQNSKSKL